MLLIILGLLFTAIGLLGWYLSIVRKAEQIKLPSTRLAVFMLPIFGLFLIVLGFSTLGR